MLIKFNTKSTIIPVILHGEVHSMFDSKKVLLPVLAFLLFAESIFITKPSQAATVTFSGNPYGSCYRYPSRSSFFSDNGCAYPSSNAYGNLRSITWGNVLGGNTPAIVEFRDASNYNRVMSRCNLGRTLNFAGDNICYNPKPYTPTIIRIVPISTYSTTNFYLNPS